MVKLNQILGNKLGQGENVLTPVAKAKIVIKRFNRAIQGNFITPCINIDKDGFVKMSYEKGSYSELNRSALSVFRNSEFADAIKTKGEILLNNKVVNLEEEGLTVIPIIKVKFDCPKSDITNLYIVRENDLRLKAMFCEYLPEGIKVERQYRVFTWTQSSEKERTYFALADKYFFEGGPAEQLLNRLMFVDRRNITTEDGLKPIVKRLGLFATSSLNIGKANTSDYCVVLLKDKFHMANDWECVSNEETNQFDGAMFLGKTFIENSILRKFGIDGKYVDARDFGFQTRIQNFSAKCYARVLDDHKLEHFKTLDNIIILGNPNAPVAAVVDSDGYKTEPVIGAPCFVHILDIAKSSETNLNVQVLNKIPTTKESIDVLYNGLKEGFESYSIDTRKHSLASLSNAIDVNNYIMAQVASEDCSDHLIEKVNKDHNLRKTLLKQNAKEYTSKVKAGKIPADATFLRVLFEDNIIFGYDSILKAENCEAYSRDILVNKAEEIEAIESSDKSVEEKDALLAELLTGVVIKNPSPGEHEYEKVVFLTDAQIMRRDCTEVAKKHLMSNPYGSIILACSTAIKPKLAGFDTDYDGMSVIMGDAAKLILSNTDKTQDISRITLIKRD